MQTLEFKIILKNKKTWQGLAKLANLLKQLAGILRLFCELPIS